MYLEKKELRSYLKKRLLSLSAKEKERKSRNIVKLLSGLPIYKYSKVIMGYYPLKEEVDILGLLRKAYSQGKRICFPVLDLKKKKLSCWEVKNLKEDFSEGPYRIKEPNINKAKEIDPREIDLVLVPGLGFDYQANRLGRGKGFYDRFLKRIKAPTVKVGIAFACQVLESLPIHAQFDQKVDFLVSEGFIL